MTDVISLVHDFSVEMVLGTEGRVSLANLMEFSHFVDLYVLEDRIIMDDEPELKKLLASDESPLVPLRSAPEINNALRANLITIQTAMLMIYSFSPGENRFSIGSYKYWLDTNEERRKEILELKGSEISIPDFEAKYEAKYGNQERLLDWSRQMDESLFEMLEELGKTTLVVMPSTKSLIPFLEVFHQIDTPAQILYRNVVSKHRTIVEKILELNRPRAVYLPPLLTVLLSRSEDATEMPTRLKELRAEFAELRREIQVWRNEMNNKHTLREQFELREELDRSLQTMASRFEQHRRGFYRNVSGALLDALEDGDLRDIVTKPATAIVKEGLDLVPDLFRSRQFTSLIDMLDLAVNVSDYSRLLENVFGDRLDVSQYEITNARKYQKVLEERYSIAPALVT